jgi:hypothetical protein
MPSLPASINGPNQSLETDDARPDSTAGEKSSISSVNTGSAGDLSQNSQPKDDGPANSGLDEVGTVVSPQAMTLEKAEGILRKKWDDDLKHKDIYLSKEELSPGIMRYGTKRSGNPYMACRNSWDELSIYWDEQYSYCWQHHERKAALAVCIRYMVLTEIERERYEKECEEENKKVFKYAQGRG